MSFAFLLLFCSFHFKLPKKNFFYAVVTCHIKASEALPKGPHIVVTKTKTTITTLYHQCYQEGFPYLRNSGHFVIAVGTQCTCKNI